MDVATQVHEAIAQPSLGRQVLILRQQLELQATATNKMRGQYEALRQADQARFAADTRTMVESIQRLQARCRAAGLDET